MNFCGPQAWIYSPLILVAGIGGRIWAEQRHPGLTAKRQSLENLQTTKTWDKVLAPLMAVSIGYPMMTVAGLDHRYNWPPGLPLWSSVIKFIMIALGYFFASWAVAENRFFFTVLRIQTDRGHGVCDTGPYRFVRHPGYAENILPLFGIVLALDSVWTLIPATVATSITDSWGYSGGPAGRRNRSSGALDTSIDKVSGCPSARLRCTLSAPDNEYRESDIALMLYGYKQCYLI